MYLIIIINQILNNKTGELNLNVFKIEVFFPPQQLPLDWFDDFFLNLCIQYKNKKTGGKFGNRTKWFTKPLFCEWFLTCHPSVVYKHDSGYKN